MNCGKRREEMKILKMNEVPKEPYATRLFTGSEITRQNLFASQDLKLSVVNFGRGVRNKFHTHDGDQVLIITSGEGIVATEKEEKIVTPGDVVLFPAGEKHWHGATKESEFSHIYITKTGVTMKQVED
jgi:quercetin dioxygenase-like cupin family protein